MRSVSCVVMAALAGCGSVSANKSDAGANADVGVNSAALTLAKPSRWVPQNGSATVDFTIERGAMVTGALTVHVSGLPAGVTAADVAVAAGATTGSISFSATTAAQVGATTNTTIELQSGSDMLDSDAFGVFVSGAPGTLDTTWGTNGVKKFPLPDPVLTTGNGNGFPRAVAQYPATGANAGKIVLAVELDTTGGTSDTHKIAVVRLNADGTTDTGFGSSGYALIDASPAHGFYPGGIQVDSMGRIVLVASRQNTSDVCEVYMTRLLPNGVVDPGWTTFDTGSPAGFCGHPTALKVLGDDRAVAVSTWNVSDGSQRPLLMQAKADGNIDNSAFSSGWSIQMGNPSTTKPTWNTSSMILDELGRILVAGYKCEGGWNATHSACESVVGRIVGQGTWDATFGVSAAGNGKGYSSLAFGTTAASPQEQMFYGLALDANHDIITVGWNEGYTTGTIAKFKGTDGAVDTSFGTSGRVTPTLVTGATIQELTSVAVDSEGRLVMAGYVVNGSPLIATTRYSATGALDTTWGTNGVQTAPSAAFDPRGLLQADDRLIVVGSVPRGANGSDVAVWRFWP